MEKTNDSDNVCVITTFNITDTLTTTGYYKMTNLEWSQVSEWNDDFNVYNKECPISSDIIITPDNFSIMLIDDFDFFNNPIIVKYGNPCEILEHIPELDFLFNKTHRNIRISNTQNDSDSDDSMLYTDTENVQDLINAHINQDSNKIKQLLDDNSYDDTDDIIKKIKNENYIV
jgi:hypothetical protein